MIQYRLLFVALMLTPLAHAADFTLTSPQIKPNERMADEQVFNGFGCQGGNISPALQWSNAPAGTKSFALTMYDPDAPTGSGWWHWVMFNIPATAKGLEKNASQGTLPGGAVQSRTDFGKPGYGGPCPPAGDKPHRYEITVYALKTDTLPLDANAPGAMVGFYIHQNAIGQARITGHYARNK